MGKLTVTIKTLSPLHLGSGQESIIVDSDVVHDQYGMPYFPAKRFRGPFMKAPWSWRKWMQVGQI